MELKELQRNWNTFAERDPLYAILTVPSKLGRQWKPAEFFRTGVEEIDAVMTDLRAVGASPGRGEALDFGCGVGRLTQALCRHFDACAGVDIAPTMVELAREYNLFGTRCRYFVNDRADLALFENDRFQFIYSNIVLQHMRPEYAREYIKEFLRVLAPGGLLAFQLPSAPTDPALQSRPLPDSGFRAGVEIIDAPRTLRPGARSTIRIRLTNQSDATWPKLWNGRGQCHVCVGNHWRDAAGAVQRFDDGRAGLEHDLKPGERVEITIPITTPPSAGLYLLEVDAVQEGVSWFHEKGSTTASVPVRVRTPALRRLSEIYRKAAPVREASVAPRDEFQPTMEMYGIPHAEVAALLERLGGRVIDLKVWPTAHWTHARYVVSKR